MRVGILLLFFLTYLRSTMTYIPLTLARRHVLGDLYSRCERSDQIPVYLGSPNGERLGFADESWGNYADAFTFHIAEEYCKKLGAGHFTDSFEYDFADGAKSEASPLKRKIRLSSIVLVMRKGYEKPTPKTKVGTAPAEGDPSDKVA
jgi:hypothetical protein